MVTFTASGSRLGKVLDLETRQKRSDLVRHFAAGEAAAPPDLPPPGPLVDTGHWSHIVLRVASWSNSISHPGATSTESEVDAAFTFPALFQFTVSRDRI